MEPVFPLSLKTTPQQSTANMRLSLPSAVLFGLISASLPAAQGQPGAGSPQLHPLFAPPPSGSGAALYADQAAVLQRNVVLDLELLGSNDAGELRPEDGVLINLFDGVEFVGRFQGYQPIHDGGYVAEFALQGVDHGFAFFSVMDEAVVATVRADGELYKVNYVGGGTHTVSHIDESLEPACGTDQGFSVGAGGQAGHGTPPGSGGRFIDHEIDVMVLYTDDARASNGGSSGINALINLAIFETNKGFSQSDVASRYMLVHTEEVAYAETGDEVTLLSRLRGTADGFLDEIHALRDAYGADLVSCIYDSGSYCGVGYLMTTLSTTFESSAFNVVRDSCATGYYSFGHECGHNSGSAHDTANAGSAVFSYSYGWRTSDSAYRTVMAYAPGSRILFWSNPDKVAPNGLVLGTTTDDNARSQNDVATTVSAFRSSVDYGHRVLTQMNSNNGFAGNMFNLTPKTDVEVWALAVNTSSTGTESFDVWVREGGYQGYESNSAAWELWGSYTRTTCAGTDGYTYIYPGTRQFDGDTTYGVYIDMTTQPTSGSTFRYTNGAAQSWENNFLRVETGIGKGAGFAGSTIADRQWNGALYYRGATGQVALSTTFASNNGFAGNMFDLEVANSVTVHSFDVNIDSTAGAGTAHVDVWMRTGSYVGHEDDSNDWTYLGTDLATVAAGSDNSTRVAVGDVNLSAGTTYAFYFNLASYPSGQIMRYTNAAGGEVFENSDLRIGPGVGTTGEAFTGGTISNRIWNGRIHYSGNHSGPHLWMADLQGDATNFVHMAGCVPGAQQWASWSVAGGGPQGSPWGTVYLSNPYFTLPPIAADGNGNATLSTYSPPAASGRQVWVQSLDAGNLSLTNGATLVIQ